MDLSFHRPNEAAVQRAKAAGIDLDEIKHTNPEQYKMLNAQQLLHVALPLSEDAGAVFFALFPQHDLFQIDQEDNKTFLAFPPLNKSKLGRLDDAMAKLSALAKYQADYLYYRVVEDQSGVRRELALPIAPESWQNELGLVGPFASQAEADAWGEKIQMPFGQDSMAYLKTWFCDVFLLNE